MKSPYSQLIDHTYLKPNASLGHIEMLCAQAKEKKFKAVCVSPTWVKTCRRDLSCSSVSLCTVVGFPSGAHCVETKVFEATRAVKEGADEIDAVINRQFIADRRFDLLEQEMCLLRAATSGRILKLIFETSELTDSAIVRCCELANRCHVDFVKTSTGFSLAGGATVHHVRLMRQASGVHMGVKASGGIRNRADVLKMVEAGATRIGTSCGVQIVAGE